MKTTFSGGVRYWFYRNKYIQIYFYDAYNFLYKIQASFYPELNTMNNKFDLGCFLSA